MPFKKEQIGLKIWVSGTFTLYKTDNITKFIAGPFTSAEGIKRFSKDPTVILPKMEVMIVDESKFMSNEGDIFLA